MPAMTEVGEAIYLNSLNPGSVLDVLTKHHRYRIEYLGTESIRISGHPTLCPTPTLAQLLGSIRPGDRLEPGVVRGGMHLAFRRQDASLPVTTSEITEVRVIQTGPRN